MGRKSNYSTATVPKRIPNYALKQVEHLARCLDSGSEVHALVLLNEAETSKAPVWHYVVYSQTGIQQTRLAPFQSEPSIPIEPRLIEIEIETESIVEAAAVPDDVGGPEQELDLQQELAPAVLHRQIEPAIAQLASTNKAESEAFARRLYREWQSQSSAVWGRTVSLEQIYETGFSGILLVSFLAQLSTALEMELDGARLELVHSLEKERSYRVGNGQVNSLTYRPHQQMILDQGHDLSSASFSATLVQGSAIGGLDQACLDANSQEQVEEVAKSSVEPVLNRLSRIVQILALKPTVGSVRRR